ncbi:receptor kinase-like protein Xa21 isoform X1 [Brachypodium distachyon]|uniref:Receptor kinase-like protein Xa21 n=1 Tax=Brachypodium distachyon TaxID=15368 RepID=I1IN52_BRADI|nr:receptor kinase-like protein Xa21 isoform X1 [Brachypodium distachyon]XP_024318851.1 receptor kinase-like protein Xa21 isoform X1 [Brachypodium distachyon]XP_024318852.1 receptor kinase-like protein Xa21 isoform X1 [Brachypodium distachyon]KQJ89243.1 hypothetical protein BRADI_4g24410v3 [Brachypodium distachyon]KQJ89244.1 hypothetical protein BRADI_4g24410v3 [Brachypodium distachyon]PNT64091.1 hypothetical protein BRADI_4g24410v3 [Brachypodium distachyon]|eukprot:XP_010237898.1 receptor kinase-like protein Xa21 isoform X1 [Brachypodium distachyon]
MRVTSIMQFILGLMVCNGHAVICDSLYGNETDRLSLLEFKNAISLDPKQSLMSWNDSIHFCNWEGVHCRIKNPLRVISLDLANRGLVGQISPSLGNLTLLKHLFLSTNRFTGTIPPALGHLHRLQNLYLSNNTLQGTIPSLANCSNLKALWLDRNQLVGQIPTDLPPFLEKLQLSVNNLTGTIPASLANITSLNQFNFALNSIEGNIPNELRKLPALHILNAGGNQLTGTFPQAILNLSTLVSLNLGQNRLSGEVPSNLGNSLPNLQAFALANNFFHGEIPSSLINASELSKFDISSNNFTGLILRSIGRLSKLTWLNLEFNKLQARSKEDWEFMSSLANCTKLNAFSVEGNHLEGEVPTSLSNLSIQLQNLYLGRNQLTGGFPSGIANLPNLIVLGMNSNRFTGNIPQWLGTLKSLQILGLASNTFTGFIPSSLSNLSQLTYLLLDSNQFVGSIPPSFRNLQGLSILNISNNNLSGRVPKEIFSIPTLMQIYLSFNNIDGELPTDIANAKQLTNLELSSNRLSGVVPSTLGNCASLQDIKLDWNNFSGSIPISISKISSLQILSVSHNNITGSIPVSLGNLQYLEQLDLSFNHLEGEVPTKGIFMNVTAVQIDGNQGLCGGTLELHLMACSATPSNSTKHKLFLVLKVVIPVACMVSLVMIILVLLFWRRKHKRETMSLPSFGGSFGRQFPKVSFIDLDRATEGFSTSNIIGRGIHGSVYQGKLFEDGNDVAIKVFNLETRGAQKSFIAECNALSNVRHRNLLPILTACSSIDSNGNDFKALVYEFMPRGDLHRLLYSTQDYEGSADLIHITLAQRLSIVVDVADALEYLHHNNQGTIVHCDMKPSNILLDDNMTAHVGDFGLARFKVDSGVSSSDDPYSTSLIAIKGTIGYVAPECATGGHVSTASDVYSFGIVLLEIFLRKRPTDDMFKDGLDIAKFVEMNFPESMSQIVEPELLQDQPEFTKGSPVVTKENDLGSLISVLRIGLCCTKLSPNERPNMQEVASKLHGIKEAYLRGY